MSPTNSGHMSTTHFLVFLSPSYKYSVCPKDINGVQDVAFVFLYKLIKFQTRYNNKFKEFMLEDAI